MPFMILYGGELVFLFVGARVAHWMWRSRDQVMALWRARHGQPGAGPAYTPDPSAAPRPKAPVRIRPSPRRRTARAPSARAA
jgi:hypothetical protein